MVAINVKSSSGELEIVKGLLREGINEEKRKIDFAISVTANKIEKYEAKYGMSTAFFIEKFKKGEIKENDETFEWWAETKLAGELAEKLKALKDIEICQQ